MISPELKITSDGSLTLVHPILGDLYHSVNGAVGESEHVYIASGLEFVLKDNLSILEVGFGSGLNAFLTLNRAKGFKVDYHAVELYPITIEVAETLNYSDDDIFMQLHRASWEERNQITDDFCLTKWAQDLLNIEFFTKFDLVYFDAFAPDTQAELWSEAVFKKIIDAMPVGGVLVTYCAKGMVKQALRNVGFKLTRLKGALGKHHMIRAIKI